MGEGKIGVTAVSISDLLKHMGKKQDDAFWRGQLEKIDGLNRDGKRRLQSAGEQDGLLTSWEVASSDKESYHDGWLTTAWKVLTKEEKAEVRAGWIRAVYAGDSKEAEVSLLQAFNELDWSK